MCGICGVYYFRDGDPREPDAAPAMARTLRHRGPDAEGFHAEGRVRLGHRRLRIIDLAHGDQPMANEDGSVRVSFNGEIFNFVELREWLEGRGHRFRTRSDTEVIVHLYEELGEGCVERLRGQFAFAVWDARRERVVLARDRLGIKPLYWGVDRGRCLFASELRGILAALDALPPIDEEALLEYLTYLYVPAPRTILRGVHKLEPGHILILDPDGTTLRRYWDLSFDEDRSAGSVDAVAEEVLDALREAVRIRLVSEVPLGAFLSGGIDSSAVVALMAEVAAEPVRTFSVGFREARFNELPHARDLAEAVGSRHFETVVASRPETVLDRISSVYDEPFADSSSIPTYTVSEITKAHVTVALSGDGGDENFAGYRRYRFDLLENRIRRRIPAPIRRGVVGPLARVYPKADWLPRMFRGRTLLGNLAVDPDRGYFRTQASAPRPQLDAMLQADLRNRLRGHDPFSVLERHFRNAPRDPLSRIQYVDFKTYLPDDILTKVDRASMAHSLEVRVPILDHSFVERVARIPSSLKLRGGEGKYVFKRALRGVVPDGILDREKMGFSVPLAKWMRDELRPAFRECLDDPAMGAFFDVREIEGMWKRHRAKVRDFAIPLYAVLAFHRWHRSFAAPAASSRARPVGAGGGA
jgi:asparagine synthase (glutamine-hydrolysing)